MISVAKILCVTFILLVSILSCARQPAAVGKTPPRAVNGVIDLRNWDFEKDGPVQLDGDWHFYWKELLTAEDLKNRPEPGGIISVPGKWDDYTVDGRQAGATGYATYRLTILVKKSLSDQLGLRLKFISSSYELETDGGEFYKEGKVGTDDSNSIFANVIRIVPVSQKDGTLNILIRVSNFQYSEGGMIRPIAIGGFHRLQKEYYDNALVECIMIGILFIMGLYHLGLYIIRRQDVSPLWFGVVALVLTLWSTLVGSEFLYNRSPSEYHWILYKIEYLTFYIGFALFGLYSYSLFPGEIKRGALVLMFLVSGSFSIFCIAVPSILFSRHHIWFQLFTVVSGLYLIGLVILAVIRNREGSRLFLLAWLILFSATVNDILYYQRIINTGAFVIFGFITFIFLQAFLLSIRFSKSFNRVAELSSELEVKNADLTRLESLKDDFLANTSHELRTPLNGIIGLAESLSQGAAGELGLKANANLRMITASGKRLANLVNDILDFSKLRNHEINLQRRGVDIRSLADVVLTLSRSLLSDKAITLENNIHENIPLAWADENRLQQIFFNLIGNAIKFTHEGKVELGARIQEAGIAGKDSGVGIQGLGRNQKVSEGRTVYTYTANEEGRNIDTVQHSRGLGSRIYKRLYTILANFKRLSVRTGNAASDSGKIGIPGKSELRPEFRNDFRNRQDDQFFDKELIIENEPLNPNSQILISISDTGIGIPADKLHSIFQSFEQADGSIEREYGGTGLGLAVTKSLVELHGGRIWVESVLGQGSTFYFNLPVAADQNSAPLTTAEPDKISAVRVSNLVRAEEIPRRQNRVEISETDEVYLSEKDRRETVITNVDTNLKVLVVDDEPVNLQVIVNNLTLAGIEVTEAASGERALESLAEYEPDLVLLDVMMPRMNGYDTAKKIREKYSLDKLPIIFLTARNQVNALVEGYAAGGNDFIAKPFSRNELLSRINIHVKLSRLLKQERFSVIGQMAGGIVHDLKNPISSIKAYAEMVRDFELDDKDKKEYLTIIESEADRLSDMAHSILDFVKGEIHLNLESVDLKVYIADVAKFIKPVFDADSKHLHWQIDRNGPVRIDQDRMRRVIINLANNAREVLEPGGNFTIYASLEEKLLLTFTDDGPGIPVQIEDKLFQPFATHGKAAGTGLGLAMVRQIVEAHGGSVTCESPAAEGRGARFVVAVPVKK